MKSSPEELKNFTPAAAAAPQPASFVALPPSPRIIRVAPRRAASSRSSPTPKVVVRSGSGLSPASGSPAAAAISMTAVPSGSRP